jgi:phosphomevalonate kinase
MSFALRATAPGKLVLAGEYAVVDGGVALSTGVNVRAIAQLSSLAGAYNELHILNSDTTTQFQCEADGVIHWRTRPDEDTAILAAVIAALHALDLWQVPATRFRLTLDSRNFYHSGDRASGNAGKQKLGLGSSAAVCVATMGVFLELLNIRQELPYFLAAHKQLQQGRGSGVDVVTSFNGGVVQYQCEVPDEPVCRQLAWPAGLHVLPVWTGKSASTIGMLDRLANFRQQHTDEYARLMGELSAAGAYVAARWGSGETDVLLTGLQDFAERLQTLDQAAAIGIWSDVHQELGRIAGEFDAVYKPSGAGSGDFGLAFSRDQNRLAELGEELARHDFEVPELDLASEGLEVSRL